MASKRPDMVLILPPWQPSLLSEYCALPWLSALADAHGYSVETDNLNRRLLFSVANGRGVQRASDLLWTALRTVERTSRLDRQGLELYLIARRALDLADRLMERRPLCEEAELAAPAYFLKCLTLFTDRLGSGSGRSFAAGDIGGELWSALVEPVYRDAIVALQSSRPRSVGFCIPFSEVVPGVFALLPRIRESLADIHIAAGGPATALATDDVLATALADGALDSIIRYDAEDAFIQLIEAIRGLRPLSAVDNLLHRSKEIPETAYAPPRTRLSQLGAMRYRLQQPILRPVNLLAAHGCFWGRCAYCCYSSIHGPDQSFRCRPAADLVDEVQHLNSEYGADEFLLAAESLPGRMCRDFSRGLLDRGLDVRWYSFVRPGPWYDLECLRLMAESGFDSRWSVSIEAGSDPVLQRMNRGYSKRELVEFLARCRDVGIRFGWANIIHDFPGTTYEQALETLAVIADHADLLRFGVSLNSFRLKAQSSMGRRPHDWGLVNVEWGPGEATGFKAADGMTPDQLADVEHRYTELALRFTPVAHELAQLHQAMHDEALMNELSLELSTGDVTCCTTAFADDGSQVPSGSALALYPSGRVSEALYFQYNVRLDFALACVVEREEGDLVARLLHNKGSGLPLATVFSELSTHRVRSAGDQQAPIDRMVKLLAAGARLTRTASAEPESVSASSDH